MLFQLKKVIDLMKVGQLKTSPTVIFASIFTLFLMQQPLVAQREKKNKENSNAQDELSYVSEKITDNMFDDSDEETYYFSFNHVNKHGIYYNKTKLDHIKHLEEKNNEFELIKALEDYIRHFHIGNFSKNNELLWKLAQLYEKNEDMAKAKAAYKLVLKHHPTKSVDQIRQYFKIKNNYDDITELDQDYYVPLEYYYELVEYRRLIDTLRPPKSVLANMGDLVNSRSVPDYGPSINVHDSFMIFTKRTLDKKHIGATPRYNENLYFSKNYDDFWDEAQIFPKPINSSCNEGSACLSNDGKTLFFTRCKIEDNILDCSDCLGSCDIYVSHKDLDDNWSQPKNLGKNVNSIAWDSHPSLSSSEDTLYFASDRPGGFGVSDIYFTHRIKDDKWAPAQNMGPIINTRGNEYSPYMNKKFNVFYFSSNGQLFNFDDVENNKEHRTLDIYKAYKRGGKWQEPKNIGPLVNGHGDEYYFTIDSKSKNLYYARTEENTDDKYQTDLFAFPVPMEAQPNATTRISGSLVDEETGNPYQGIVSIIDLENGIEVAPKNVREDGTYEFDLINHNKYLLVIQGDDFFRIEKLFELNGDTTIEAKAQSVKNRKLRFASIEFENGSSEILPEMEGDLWDVVNFLVDNPNFNLVISGHTDSDGDPKSNLKLSQDRADAIKQFIVEKGFVSSDRIMAIGYGDTKPIRTPEVTDEDKRINRRVEFEINNNGNADSNKFSDEDFEKQFEVTDDDEW